VESFMVSVDLMCCNASYMLLANSTQDLIAMQ
jgi:hypothetical protein